MDPVQHQHGKHAAQPTTLFYQDWTRERFAAIPFDLLPTVAHPRYHPPAGQTAFWDETIHFANTVNKMGGD